MVCQDGDLTSRLNFIFFAWSFLTQLKSTYFSLNQLLFHNLFLAYLCLCLTWGCTHNFSRLGDSLSSLFSHSSSSSIACLHYLSRMRKSDCSNITFELRSIPTQKREKVQLERKENPRRNTQMTVGWAVCVCFREEVWRNHICLNLNLQTNI